MLLLSSSVVLRKQQPEVAFPVQLYKLLEDVETAGEIDIISWSDDGRSFLIYQPKVFASTWMPRYFNQTKYKSFQRQLNLYNFHREPKGDIKGVCKYPTREVLFVQPPTTTANIISLLFNRLS
jgi:hypothetical protein